MSDNLVIHGNVEAGFGPVADAFRKNFTDSGEIGAALAIYQGDRSLVDVWAGIRDRAGRLPWERDTLVPVFSSTKGMAAFVVAAAVSEGLLDYDAPVVQYWPEFGAHGKDRVTVRQLIDHQAGLSGIDTPLRLDDLADLDALGEVLAAQKPAWKPGARQGYHAITLGLYEGELVRRVDPQRRSLGTIFAEDFAAPLGLDFFIGLPAEQSMDRIATLNATRGFDIARHERDLPLRIGVELFLQRGLAHQALTNPRVGRPERATRRKFLRVEMPGSNGVGTPRSLAKVYGAAAANTGALPIKPALIERLGSAEFSDDVPADDLILHTRSRYHLGFRKSSPAFSFGSPGDRAYGTTGLGGSFGFADPETGIGFGYAMNRLGLAILDDARCRRLRRALMRSL
ncbi:beta-lactamase family protein [Skermania sp. ID1734]|uniref:serine hydrolase domain-containing protein n=1 Tax=Skermania sp. ID1734 TaxID=2597516 RepID=UPI001180B598|nr:serine hydrolase domain-containing protein [Skermania sp. ID1734]TSE00114.1 beta-lactamase family protein [Skermania sp. ID1734]